MIDDLGRRAYRRVAGRGRRESGVTNVDWVYISIMIGVHVTVWEQAVGEK